MVDTIKISELPAATNIAANDVLPGVQGGVTKKFADSLLATTLSPKAGCRVATTANLNATYNNGSSGVGATLTNAGTKAALVINGVTLAANDRVVVKDQSTQFQNGIYIVTNVGSGAVNWILTRATDFDTTAKVALGAYTVVAQGTLDAAATYIQNNPASITIGTTAITFAVRSSSSSTFSPANTIYVATNGSVSGDGTFGNPYALPSQGIAACVSAGVSATNPYLLVVQEGSYTETVDLSLARPGLFSNFVDGVRLTMTNHYLTAAGWSGAQGITGIRGFAPLNFAGIDMTLLPSDSQMELLLWDNNWNAVTDSSIIYSNNQSANSILIADNSDLFIAECGPGFDAVYNGCRGYVISGVSNDYQNSEIYLNGGTYFTSYSATSDRVSGTTANINTFLTSAFIGAADITLNSTTGSATISYTPGQIGQLTLNNNGAGGPFATANCQVEGRHPTPDTDMLNWFYQDTVDAKHTGSGRINSKFRDSGGVLFTTSRCSPINFRVKQTSQQTITNNTLTLLTLDNEAFDLGGYWASNTYTPGMPGKYQFNFVGSYSAPGGALIDATFSFYKNNALVASSTLSIALGKVGTITLSFLEVFNGSTDQLQVKTIFTGNGGSNLTIDNSDDKTFITGFRVSD